MYINNPITFKNQTYSFDTFRGCLYLENQLLTKYDATDNHNSSVCVNNPFLVTERKGSNVSDINISIFCKLYAKLLVALCAKCYPIAYLLSHLRMPIFPDAGDANLAFRKIIGGKQNLLCLPRAIFIATTSKKFRKYGTMFIGCFFPSRNLHAWVIEENMQADIFDKYWILYTPVAKMN